MEVEKIFWTSITNIWIRIFHGKFFRIKKLETFYRFIAEEMLGKFVGCWFSSNFARTYRKTHSNLSFSCICYKILGCVHYIFIFGKFVFGRWPTTPTLPPFRTLFLKKIVPKFCLYRGDYTLCGRHFLYIHVVKPYSRDWYRLLTYN